MNIEIHQPRLEALIEERMASGQFESIEDLLLQTLEASPSDEVPEASAKAPKEKKQNFSDFMLESPLHGSGLVIERIKDFPRPIDL
jgi:hypothetical protein